jgi:RNA polymerase sigma factor (sigma-70 family)
MAAESITAAQAQADPGAVLSANIGLVRSVIRGVAHRHRLYGSARDELESAVWLRLVDHDYRAIRQYKGRSSFATFLTVVVTRLALDQRSAEGGRWRPSRRATRLGAAAVEFERLVFRDGYPRDEAAAVLAGGPDGAPSHAARALANAPRSVRRSAVPIDAVAHTLYSPDDPAASLLSRERRDRARSIAHTLACALARLSPADRRLLALRHQRGWKVPAMARLLGLDQRRLYRRLGAAHRRLQRLTETAGVTAADAAELVGARDVVWPRLAALAADVGGRAGSGARL